MISGYVCDRYLYAAESKLRKKNQKNSTSPQDRANRHFKLDAQTWLGREGDLVRDGFVADIKLSKLT